MSPVVIFIAAVLAVPAIAAVVRRLWRSAAAREITVRRAAWLTGALLAAGGGAVVLPVVMFSAAASGDGDLGWMLGWSTAGVLVTVGLLTRANVVNRIEMRGKAPGRRGGWLRIGLLAAAVGALVLPLAAYRSVTAGYWRAEWMLAAVNAGVLLALGLRIRAGVVRGLDDAGAARRCTRRTEGALVPLLAVPLAGWLVLEFMSELERDSSKALVSAGLVIGALVSAALLTRALIGDRSRGRRRCPKCWYDMSATPPPPHSGLVCPECGRDARRESRLFKSRRRKRWIAASLVPLIAGLTVYCVWLGRDGGWLRQIPTAGLIVCSPWLDWDTPMGSELSQRVDRSIRDPFSDWERWLAHRVLRGSVSAPSSGTGAEAKRQTFHLWILITLDKVDDQSAATLLALTDHADPLIAESAVHLLGPLVFSRPELAARAEETLVRVSVHPNPRVQSAVIRALWSVKRERPGGEAPALLLTAAAGSGTSMAPRACLALECFDPSEDTRRVLLSAAESASDGWTRACALQALTRHAPEDARTRELLAAFLRDATLVDNHEYVLLEILKADRWSLDAHGELSAARRALYSDDVRVAMLAAEGAAQGGAWWPEVRPRLAQHPCFTPDERGRVHLEPGVDAATGRR